MNKAIRILLIFTLISMGIALFWNNLTIVKQSVHFVLDPTAGALLTWNLTLGLALITLLINVFIVLLQKYTTDQVTLREIKKEQKLLNEEMKKFKNHPEKLMELQKKQLEFIPKTFEITLRPVMYTSIPIILLFRWFNDFFIAGQGKIFGLSWIWAYLIMSIIFSTILRKVFNVA